MLAILIYNLVLFLLSPVIVLAILAQMVIGGKTRRGQGERMGFVSRRKVRGDGPILWMHAVSVGESVAAKPIWQAMLAAMPGWRLVHSCTTDTGYDVAQKGLGEAGSLLYFPYDYLPFVWLSFARVRPSLLVLVETELWPNALLVASWVGCPVMVVNGRISERSLRGASRVPWLYRWMCGRIDRFCMQSEEDAARIIRLGADPARVVVVGNSKFDQVEPAVTLGEQVTLRNMLGLTRDEPVLLAGSTHPGEEEVALRAFRQVKQAHPEVRLVLAPRDIKRAAEIEALVTAHGYISIRRTKIGSAPAPPDAIILLDTVGELARAYGLCVAAFVGGSLVPVGGHNVLEPLAQGRAALFGPQMSNFRDIAAITLDAGLGAEVRDDAELARQWLAYLNDPALRDKVARQASTTFHAHMGASRRCAAEAARLAGLPRNRASV
jgi:3-deoxy-D-manno-octulosonic-acid transferase